MWEWTNSLWGADVNKPEFGYPYAATDARENPSAPDTVLRIVRGGSLTHVAQFVRCACRRGFCPSDRYDNSGFRVVTLGF